MGEPGVTSGEVAQTLAEFWEELLLTAPAGTERFLEAGGNSLLATMLANRIEFTWGIRPSLEELLTFSFGELSDWCGEHRLA